MINISESAGYKIKEMMQQEENANEQYLRLEVKTGGCSGFSYGMGFDSEKHEQDKVYTEQGIRVLVDAESEPLLNGVEVDFKESMMGGGFTINNPNALVSCGCGSSFRAKKAEGKPEKC